MSLLLTDPAGKNDLHCTVGSKPRRKSLPRLLMSLLRSNPNGSLYFSPSFPQSVFLSSFYPFLAADSLSISWNTLQKCVPTANALLTCTVLICCLQFLTITRRLSPDKSNGSACLFDCVQRWPIDGHRS